MQSVRSRLIRRRLSNVFREVRHLRVKFAKSTKVRLDRLKRNDAHACIRSTVQHTSQPDPPNLPCLWDERTFGWYRAMFQSI